MTTRICNPEYRRNDTKPGRGRICVDCRTALMDDGFNTPRGTLCTDCMGRDRPPYRVHLPASNTWRPATRTREDGETENKPTEAL